MLRLSVTGVPDAWDSGGRLDSLLMGCSFGDLLRVRKVIAWRKCARLSSAIPAGGESRLERSQRRGRCESWGPRLSRRPCDALGPYEHRQDSFPERIYSAILLSRGPPASATRRSAASCI